MDIFDTLGRTMDHLTDRYFEPGMHEIRRDMHHLRPGMYLIVASTGRSTETRPFLILP